MPPALPLLAAGFFLAAFGSISGNVFAKLKPETATPKTFERDVKPLLEKYCYNCHGETKKKADLSLEVYENLSSILKDKTVWEKVLHNVQTREMPPENKPQPSDAERLLLAKWIETEVFQCDCGNPDPGRVTLHRLNRTEYNNSIRDLLGVKFRPADDFPSDDTGYGFDNIGDVLSLSPILLEKYMAAAEKILRKAIVTDFSTNGITNRFEAEQIRSTAPGNIYKSTAFRLAREGELAVTYDFPRNGEYIFRVRAFGKQAGPDPARMELRLEGAILKTVDVVAVENSPSIYEIHFKTSGGEKKLSAAFINNFVDLKESNPSRRDRDLVIDYLEINGPVGVPVLPESHKRIFTRAVPSSTSARKLYAREILQKFTRLAYRRPVTPEEVDRLGQLAQAAQDEGENFESGIKLALQAVLVSPHFLFRGEFQTNPNNSKSIQPIDEFALASRLSFFLWSSMPDEELLRLAEHGKLRKQLESQVRRMMRDEKSFALVQNFAGQWLQIRNLNLVMPDAENFPTFDEALRVAMRKETELFLESLLKENRSVFDLLSANFTFLNERLARHYGIKGVSGESFRRVSLKGTSRSGILTHASILTLTSNPTRTSPVKRGKWVLENILGTPPPPPPPNVPDLQEKKDLAHAQTLRERMELHRSDPACASCHARMDPIGFAFENFDAVGSWRNKDGNATIDSSGELVSGETFQDAATLRQILVSKKKEEFLNCLSGKLLTYALGRGLEMYDRCALEEMGKHLAKNGYKFNELILEVVKSVPFQKRRGDDQETSVVSGN